MLPQQSKCLETFTVQIKLLGKMFLESFIPVRPNTQRTDFYLQSIEVRQPNTVSPAQIPSKMIMADINGLQVPGFIPKEVQNINTLQQNNFTLITEHYQQLPYLTASA